jgi:thioredoxin 1
MDEGDPASAGADARRVVDQAIPGRAARREGRVEIGHPVADVMNARPSAVEKLGDGSVRGERRKQLDFGFPKGQRDNGSAVGLLERMRRESQDITIEGQRRVEVRHGDANMSDAGEIRHFDPPVQDWSRRYQPQENNIMATTNPQTVHVTDSSFASEIEQANGLVLVDFWATWCGPCQVVGPILDQLAGEYVGKAKVAKVDVDANQRTAMRFNVRSIPSILFFKNGQHVDTVIGSVPKATLEGKIKQHLA